MGEYAQQNRQALAGILREELRIIKATEPDLEPNLGPLLAETNELVAIMTALVRKARSNPDRGGAT